jgi:hypothetical protein
MGELLLLRRRPFRSRTRDRTEPLHAVGASCARESVQHAARLSFVEPHLHIRSYEHVDFVAGQFETAEADVGDRVEPIDREADTQILVGEQPVNQVRDSLLRHVFPPRVGAIGKKVARRCEAFSGRKTAGA